MPLNTPALALAIEAILTDQYTRTKNPAQARKDFARQLAGAIAAHLITATVTGTVTTAGTAAAQTGTITTALLS